MAMIWRTRPIFVSSTFDDFQAERDVLQALVFPELPSGCEGGAIIWSPSTCGSAWKR
jgi:hypothetical protein